MQFYVIYIILYNFIYSFNKFIIIVSDFFCIFFVTYILRIFFYFVIFYSWIFLVLTIWYFHVLCYKLFISLINTFDL